MAIIRSNVTRCMSRFHSEWNIAKFWMLQSDIILGYNFEANTIGIVLLVLMLRQDEMGV